MITAPCTAIDQAQIAKLIAHLVEANCNKDVDALLSHYSKNVKVFDVVNPLEHFGPDTIRQRASEWFSTFEGPIEYENHDLRIATDADVAFSHSLNHVRGTTKEGKRLDMWWRSTVCFRKIYDKWMITHEHNSVPFDPGTGLASLNLQPEEELTAA